MRFTASGTSVYRGDILGDSNDRFLWRTDFEGASRQETFPLN